VAVGVYFWKGLYPTSALYVIFLILSVTGLIGWRRQLAAASGNVEAAA
jgi:nicotinamide mononucleotide transporter